MIALEVVPVGDGKFPQMYGKEMRRPIRMTLTALAGGMQSGLPSAAFVVELEDGSFVFAEMSLRQLLAAIDALRAVHGDPRTTEVP